MRKYDDVWCVVMFDLPVQTKKQRKESAKFRKLLLNAGYSMVQFSVYGKYSPTTNSNLAVENFIKKNLPTDGEVRIFHLTDAQWAAATRFRSQKQVKQELKTEQITLF